MKYFYLFMFVFSLMCFFNNVTQGSYLAFADLACGAYWAYTLNRTKA